MIQLYAIDPNLFVSRSSVADLFDRFGDMQPHRFILEAPDEAWREAVLEKIRKLRVSPIARKCHTENLIRLWKQKRLVSRLETGRVGRNWLDEYEASLKTCPISGIFVDESRVSPENHLYSWADPHTEGPERWGEITESYPKVAENYSKLIGGLVQLSEKFHLVDPYIWPHVTGAWGDTAPIVEEIIRTIQDFGPAHRSSELIIHTCDDDDGFGQARGGLELILNQRQNWWLTISRVNPRVKVCFRVWRKQRLDGEREHDRYFFTNRGGLSFSSSFQLNENASCDVHMLRYAKLCELRGRYKTPASDLVEEVWAPSISENH